MARNFDEALLDPRRYPFEITMTTRFADLDLNNHINNIALSVAFEDARARFGRVTIPVRPDTKLMVVASNIDFLAQAHYPEPIRVVLGVEAMGRTSWTIVCLALQDEVIAFNRCVLVCSDGVKATPLSDEIRAAMAPYALRPPIAS
jgi:acyl-CoA thioester hydrolase